MTDLALKRRDRATEVADRARALSRLRAGDAVFRNLTPRGRSVVLVILGGVFVSLVDGVLRRRSQLSGSISSRRSAGTPSPKSSARSAPIYGTLVTSLIAMLIAVPVGLGIAIFLTELCPPWLRRPIGIAIELLAGIPSIIYGIWGLFVLAPFLQQTVQPALIDSSASPGCSALFAGPPYGIGILTAGLILAIMVLPFMASISRDVFETVPPVLKEAAYGIGCTTWEVVRSVVLPYTRVGVIGGVMLGLGRALGETMAVTFVIGNAHRISALAARARHDHLGHHRQRVHRGRRRPLHVGAHRARPHAVPDHLRRPRRRALHADAARAPARRPEPMSLYAAPRGAGNAIAMALSRCRGRLRPRRGWSLILGMLLWQGFSGLSLAVFTEMTPPPGNAGGLLNAIVGSLMMTVLAVLIGTPLGILAGTYLAEYGRDTKLTTVVRFINDILLSAPSIVVGLFIYEIMVVPMGHFSGLAGAVALALIVVPVIVRTTEDMLRLVPNQLREAASALGTAALARHPRASSTAPRAPA